MGTLLSNYKAQSIKEQIIYISYTHAQLNVKVPL